MRDEGKAVVREKQRKPRQGEGRVEVGGKFAHICDSAQSTEMSSGHRLVTMRHF